MVVLFGLLKVLVESFVPANGRVQNLSAVVVAVSLGKNHEYVVLVAESH